MSVNKTNRRAYAQQEKTFARFTLGQRWEHGILILSTLVLLLTGLPQKYRDMSWSQDLLSTPERLDLVRQIHHIAALILAMEALYHVGRAIYLLARRKMPAAMFPTMQDVYDAWHMIQYLLFLRKEKPAFGKYNFEQKVTYWFLFLALRLWESVALSFGSRCSSRNSFPAGSSLPPKWHIAPNPLSPQYLFLFGTSITFI